MNLSARSVDLRNMLSQADELARIMDRNTQILLERKPGATAPLVLWTNRVVLTDAMKQCLTRMAGWTLLGAVHNVGLDQVALVVASTDPTNPVTAVLYPNGVLDRTPGKRAFRINTGDWSATKAQTQSKIVKHIVGAVDPVPSSVGPSTSSIAME